MSKEWSFSMEVRRIAQHGEKGSGGEDEKRRSGIRTRTVVGFNNSFCFTTKDKESYVPWVGK